ncbi:hypothetical protein [Legionella spiritensis]|uniref:Uncharacterized protein n=1 Tax=Legionella spiritensis TaxID=452 RepID=A0A0W0Z9C3_LEGSP|nr:hypothetical protein [Legionella spiritensis]KTD65720.1 hypothetical protein Lspi_0432 [Legionella spiritensis]SNV43289.1 Uncharacterised protein [Legionella spiritensis]
MPKLIVKNEHNESIELLDSDNLPSPIFDMSKLYEALVKYDCITEAIEILSEVKSEWKAAILLSNLMIRQQIYDPIPDMISSMDGLSCYRVCVDSGAGFKQNSGLDILGTEGLFTCVAVMIETVDSNGIPCYYLAHINGDRADQPEIAGTVEEELERIIEDLRILTDKDNLTWQELAGEKTEITLVGQSHPINGKNIPGSKLYQQLEEKFDRELGLNITCLYASRVIFDFRQNDYSVISTKHSGRLSEGIADLHVPVVMHGQPSYCSERAASSVTFFSAEKAKTNHSLPVIESNKIAHSL